MEELVSRKWMLRFMKQAQEISTWSKDPRKAVGCYIVDPRNRNELSHGFNGFPRRIADDGRLLDRELKNMMVQHAEANAVTSAAYRGVSLAGGWAFVTKQLCSQCAGLFIQSGIERVYYLYHEPRTDVWRHSNEVAIDMLREASLLCERFEF